MEKCNLIWLNFFSLAFTAYKILNFYNLYMRNSRRRFLIVTYICSHYFCNRSLEFNLRLLKVLHDLWNSISVQNHFSLCLLKFSELWCHFPYFWVKTAVTQLERNKVPYQSFFTICSGLKWTLPYHDTVYFVWHSFCTTLLACIKQLYLYSDSQSLHIVLPMPIKRCPIKSSTNMQITTQ